MQAEAVPRRAVNLSASAEILRAAREARLNLSAVLERALIGELARVMRARWREENALAVLVYNEYVASHGMCFPGRSGA